MDPFQKIQSAVATDEVVASHQTGSRVKREPPAGVEPATPALRMRCSAN